MRKLFLYDWNIDCFINKKKYDNSDKVFYLKFNNDLSSCFCIQYNNLYLHGVKSKRNGYAKKIYNDSYWSIKPYPYNNYIINGIKESINYIELCYG